MTKPYTDEQWQAIDRARPRRSTRDLGRMRRAPDDGRRADVRLDRRPRRRRVEHRARSARPSAGSRPTLLAPAARPLRRRRLPALRPGQVVSRRAAAALGARLLLAPRRRAARGATPSLFADESAAATATAQPTPRGFVHALADAARRRCRARACRATRTSGTTCGASGGCPPTSIPLDAGSTTQMERERLRARVRAGARPGRRLRAAAARRDDGEGALAKRRRGSCAASTCTSSPGDSPMGYRLPLDSLPWASRERPRAVDRAATRFAARPPLPAYERAARAAPSPSCPVRGPTEADPPARRDGSRRAQRRPSRRRETVRTAPLRRAARRRALRLHAAGRPRSRTTSSWSPPSRPPRPRCDLPVLLEGYPPPQRSAARAASRSRPTPASSRSTSSPSADLGRAGRHHDDALRGGAAVAAGHREVHARRPPHRHRRRQPRRPRRADRRRQPVPAPARPAAQPGRATGTIIRRCRTCSPACSSARRARPRASTRRATTASTSWRSRSGSCPRRDAPPPPWLVDRLFRHLLIDVTGNTHRAEFCIDKLYSPDTAAGRRGLLELRAFEMPPHARMSLAQQLLLRALVAALLARAVRAQSSCAGARSCTTASCCRTSSGQDFEDVLAELPRGRLRRSSPTWFAPHFEFRFPRLGERRRRAASHLELRQALEPWHVLGEEARPAARRATSIRRVERLQVQVTGVTDGRHVVTCNGRARAAAPDRDQRRVRRRRALPRLAAAVGCLHPTIPRARAADVRPRRHLDGALARRLPVPRDAPGRPELRRASR